MAGRRGKALAGVVNRLLACSAGGIGGVRGEFLAILDETVRADGFALLRIHGEEGRVDLLAGAGLMLAEPSDVSDLDAPHILKQGRGFPDQPAVSLLGSFNCDPFLDREGTRALLMARGGGRDSYLAFIALRRDSVPFTAADVKRFGAVAGVVDLLERVAALEEILSNHKDRDLVTGLLNFTGFRQALSREIARARRSESSLAVCILSLDPGEDTLGDAGLLTVAGTLTEQLRSFDIVARYGPGSFALVLPELLMEDALKVSERLLGSMRQGIEGFGLGLYMGLSCYPADASAADRLIEIAEAAMSQAREAGTPGVFKWEH